jgi:hypothetical protein
MALYQEYVTLPVGMTLLMGATAALPNADAPSPSVLFHAWPLGCSLTVPATVLVGMVQMIFTNGVPFRSVVIVALAG